MYVGMCTCAVVYDGNGNGKKYCDNDYDGNMTNEMTVITIFIKIMMVRIMTRLIITIEH